MIDEMHVQDLALIRDATLTPVPGLTVLTGETGAGKTALLSALKLLMGERADASQVREGSAGVLAEGRFFAGARDLDGFTVSRRVGADGRSRVRVDGKITSVRELSDRMRRLIDLCGQHEHQRLLDPASHVEMVDAWGASSIGPALEAYRSDFHAARDAAQELRRIEAAARTQGSRLEDARFAYDRITEIDPKPGEYEELEETLPRAQHAESLASTANDAQVALSDEGGALDSLNEAIAGLSRMGGVDPKLAEFADVLSNAAITLEDAASDLRRYRDDVDFDPQELQRAQERFGELKGLLRSFGPSMDDVFRRRDEASELLGLVNDGAARVKRAQAAVDAAEGKLVASAKRLAKARNVVAPRFCREVGKQMSRLEMGGAEITWECRDLPRASWTDDGPCACELLYRSGAGLTPRPLRRIASGGELSRVMLATKVVLGEADGVDTLVFDEVDAGVGGSTARALATVLADLSRTHQVLVVTHLAQVAVMADAHYVVRKSECDVPETSLVELDAAGRVHEIARMLSGDQGGAAIAHATELLRESGKI